MSSPPPNLPPLPNPLPPDEDRGPQLMGAWWTWSALSVIMIVMRFYARYQLRSIGLDDWMMLFTVLLFVISTCFITYMAHIGGARHAFYLTPEETLRAVKFSFLSQPWAIFLFGTGKTSVALLILRIIGGYKSPGTTKTSSSGKFAINVNSRYFWRRTILYFVIISLLIISALGCIFTFVQCDPPEALWTPTLLPPLGSGTCWDPKIQLHFNYFLASWNILADIVLAVLPATFISGLNLRLAKKVALCILLSLGLIAAIFGAIKIPYLVDLGERGDFTWKAYGIQMWTGAEGFVMILCGNIPPLQVLWDRFITHKLDSSYNRVTNHTGYSGSGTGGTGRRLFSSYRSRGNTSSSSHSQSQSRIYASRGGDEDKSSARSWSGNEGVKGKNEIIIMTNSSGQGQGGQNRTRAGDGRESELQRMPPTAGAGTGSGRADRYYYGGGAAKGVSPGHGQIQVTTDMVCAFTSSTEETQQPAGKHFV